MGADEDYEQGVRDGQRGGAMDDFCKGLASSGSAYDKGYDYGADHRYNSSGERYHTYSNDGSNDPKPDTSSDSNGSWFGFGSKNDKSESSEPESSTSSNGSYSGGGGGYSSGSGGGRSSTDIGIGGLVGILGAIVIGGMICWNIFGNSNKSNVSQQKSQHPITKEEYQRMSPEEKSRRTRQYSQELRQNLEKRTKIFAQELEQNGQLEGNFKDYKVIIPPTILIQGSSDYMVAFISNHNFYVFQSSDLGKTWTQSTSTFSNPFFKKLFTEYETQLKGGGRKRGGKGKVSQAWLDGIKSRSENPYYLPSD